MSNNLEAKLTSDFYTKLKYPGPNALITYVWAKRLKPYLKNKKFTFLDAGCGSGRHTAGMLELYPNSKAICLDFSKSSIELAKELFKQKGYLNRVKFINQSFLSEIKIENKVDLGLAIGTIHHTPNPLKALKNISKTLKPGGILGLMVYSDRSSQRRYEIKKVIELLGLNKTLKVAEQAIVDYELKYDRFLDKSLRTIIRDIRNLLSHKIKVIMRIKSHGYEKSLLKSIIVADSYLTPIDVSFNTQDIKKLLEKNNLEILELLSLGRIDEKVLPRSWIKPWKKLDFWNKVQIMEIINPSPTSWSLICRKPK